MTHKDFLDQVRDVLDQSTASMDAQTASRLNRARQQALDLGLKPRSRWAWPSLALATAASLTLALSLILRMPDTASLPTAAEDLSQDLELLAGNEDLELIENLEFYAWLEQQSLDG